MAYQYPASLDQLIRELSRLPGVGAKAAQRLAFHLLSAGADQCAALAQALTIAGERVHACPGCGNFTDQDLCSICRDPSRDQSRLCVVESVADLISLERSGRYNGLYQVLGGVISPLDGIGPDQLALAQLESRAAAPEIAEIILATNPTVEGDATAIYISHRLRPLGREITRLALGMPVGGALAFTDEATLDLALQGRRKM